MIEKKCQPEPSGELSDARELLGMRARIAMVSADNENYLIKLSIKEALEVFQYIGQIEAENKLKADMIAAMHRDIRKQNDIIIKLEAK